MALIWAEGFTGERALAPLWRRRELTRARSGDTSLSAAERGQAIIDAESANTAYNNLRAEAERALQEAARDGNPRTHVMVVGVGRYENPGIPALTTSVRGAWKFAEWMLTRFRHAGRPLGSIELILSPGTLGDWQPSPEAAAKLGLTDGSGTTTLPVEAATFANIEAAFERWLTRAGTNADNSAFFYFSGHGVWKTNPFLLPEDGQIASSTRPFDNLIDIHQTQVNLINRQPSIQCFFIDACQEVALELLENLSTTPPGEPLCGSANIPFILRRDRWQFDGAVPGRLAFGPADDAPFFTQELLACMERRAASGSRTGNTWRVTTSSLGEALKAACRYREEIDERARGINFGASAPVSSTITAATLCQIQGTPEVFVEVGCTPTTATGRANLFVEFANEQNSRQRNPRPKPLPRVWYTKVNQGDCSAGAEFEESVALANASEDFVATPPLHTIELIIE